MQSNLTSGVLGYPRWTCGLFPLPRQTPLWSCRCVWRRWAWRKGRWREFQLTCSSPWLWHATGWGGQALSRRSSKLCLWSWSKENWTDGQERHQVGSLHLWLGLGIEFRSGYGTDRNAPILSNIKTLIVFRCRISILNEINPSLSANSNIVFNCFWVNATSVSQ